MTINKELKDRIDLIIKVILVVIIILLLIHNCELRKKGNRDEKTPNGNIDIIDIECDSGECSPIISDDSIKTEITELSFFSNSVSVKIGSELKLIPIIKPVSFSTAKLTWQSSDNSVATVDGNGVVRGLKEGDVIITVTSSNGISSTCVVHVTKNKIAVDKIVLDSEKLSLFVGEIHQILAKCEPENATENELTFKSNNSGIATVDSNGVVKGVKEGTAIITVTSSNGVSSTCKVQVKKNKIDVNKIVLDSNEVSLVVGNSYRIFAEVEPKNATESELTFKSNNSGIATVDSNGVVKGLKEGTAIITVTSSNGVSSTCVVYVTKNKIAVDKIVLDPDKLSLSVGGIYQILAKVEPKNATETELIFESSNPSVATVNSKGLVKGIRAGVVTITVKTKDGKVTATCEVTVESAIEPKFDVYDNENTPITWNGSNNLKIFTKSIYNVEGTIAPESENTYQFVVRNNTSYKIKYNIKFVEDNPYHINMRYKLKKDNSYLIDNYSEVSALTVNDFILNSGESNTYYLDWKWVSSSNDTSIGKNPEAKYGLEIVVGAESINE